MSEKLGWPQSLHASADLARQKAAAGIPMEPPMQPATVDLIAPNPPTVYDCIVAVSADLTREGVAKTRSNQQQGYKFRGIDEVLNALSPLLAKHRLVILPRVLARTLVERESKNGGALFYVTVEAEFDFVSAADGSRHTVKTYGEAMDSADKATNKAMSAAYKYAAFQTFCIPTEGDNDADAQTHEPKGYVVTAPAPPGAVAPNGGGLGPVPHFADFDELPKGAVRIERVNVTETKTKRQRYLVTLSTGEQPSTLNERLGTLCQELVQTKEPVYVTTKANGTFLNLEAVRRAGPPLSNQNHRDDDHLAFREGDAPF